MNNNNCDVFSVIVLFFGIAGISKILCASEVASATRT